MTYKIAIVGSGPAGCYTAQSLAKSCPDAEITIIDRLITPYGLVRYGVAADHQGTKAVSRQFARLFEKQGVSFIGNLELGQDISLEKLQACMDAVVIATGLYADRKFDVEDSDLQHIYGAGEITRYWNAHPDSEDFKPELGETVAVFGNGNVAMDIIRLLSKSGEDFEGSDLNPEHASDGVKAIHIIGRSPLENARFDAVMVNELKSIDGLRCTLADGDTLNVDENNPITTALTNLFSGADDKFSKQVIFHSGWQLEEYIGENGQLNSVSLHNSKSGKTKILPCNSAITAIGFENSGSLDRETLLANAEDAELGVISPGLFAAGWFKRGPSGTIPENRTDSQSVAQEVASWLQTVKPGKPGRSVLLDQFADRITSYEDWLVIDEIETRFAGANRCRQKIPTWKAMMTAIEQQRKAS